MDWDQLRRDFERRAREELEQRTHERTLQTLKLAVLYALIYAVAVGIIFLLSGCHYPTEPHSLGEKWADVVIQNECHKLGVSDVDILYPRFNRPAKGHPGAYWCMAAQVPDKVFVYEICTGVTDPALIVPNARHECCHLKLGHKMSIGDEAHNAAIEIEADVCAGNPTIFVYPPAGLAVRLLLFPVGGF